MLEKSILRVGSYKVYDRVLPLVGLVGLGIEAIVHVMISFIPSNVDTG